MQGYAIGDIANRRGWPPPAALPLRVGAFLLFRKARVMLRSAMWFVSGAGAVSLAGSPRAAAARDREDFHSCGEYAQAHPEMHLVGGHSAQSCLFQIPPPMFDPMTASQTQLIGYGIPQRPDATDAKAFTRWKRYADQATNPARVLPQAWDCTWNKKDFKGPGSAWNACGRTTPDGQHLLPKILPRPPKHKIDFSLPPYSGQGEGGATPMSSPNWAGFLVTNQQRGTISVTDSFYWVGSQESPPGVSVPSYATPVSDCAHRSASQTSMATGAWLGLSDKDAPYNTGLDQTGMVTTYDCTTNETTAYLFSEELPNPATLYSCGAGQGYDPGDQVNMWVNALPWNYPYPYGAFVGASGASCILLGIIKPAGENNASQGEGAAYIVESVQGANLISGPHLSYNFMGEWPQWSGWMYSTPLGGNEGPGYYPTAGEIFTDMTQFAVTPPLELDQNYLVVGKQTRRRGAYRTASNQKQPT